MASKKNLSKEEEALRDKRRKVSPFFFSLLSFQLFLQDYFCAKRFVPLESVSTWRDEIKPKLCQERKYLLETSLLENFSMTTRVDLSRKVSIYRGDMTLLEVDAIVNPTDKCMNSGFGGDKLTKFIKCK